MKYESRVKTRRRLVLYPIVLSGSVHGQGDARTMVKLATRECRSDEAEVRSMSNVT